MYFALFERLRQFRECGLPMWIQLTHHVDPTFSQDNFDNSTILRAIHTLLCRSLNHALVVETVQQPGHRSRIDRKSTRLNSSHSCAYRMPSSALNNNTHAIYRTQKHII